jgi:hypothetical protein
MAPCHIEKRGQSALRQLLPCLEITPNLPISESHFVMPVTEFIDVDTVAELSAT